MTVEEALGSWAALNQTLLSTGEQDCQNLLDWELSHLARKVYLLRIHAHLNKLRGRREREELIERSFGR